MIQTPERFTYSYDYRKIEYGDKPGDGLSVKTLQKILHERKKDDRDRKIPIAERIPLKPLRGWTE